MSADTVPAVPFFQRVWKVATLAILKYINTDGELRAASFAYYAFFALFPLVLLFVFIGSTVWAQQDVMDHVLNLVNYYFPQGQDLVVSTIAGVVKSRTQAGVVALLALAWSALRFFQALVQGVNRAWGTHEYSWWRLPLANLLMVGVLGSTLLLGVVAPVIMKAVEEFWINHSLGFGGDFIRTSFKTLRLTIPALVLFYGLLMFYKFAPQRKTLFREVWIGAAFVTGFLILLQSGFAFYANSFARFNFLYGALGSVVAVLMWIYLSGSVIIFGGCLCAAISETRGKTEE